jgi:catechol 2,3-dioxygenase-like lactoylglutathione lyase family enzyme
MKALHYGLACSSEDTADRFYEKFLGLKKSEPKNIPAALCQPLFGISSDLTVINYAGGGVHFEIFIHPSPRPSCGSPTHVCLEVETLDTFIERGQAMGVPVIRVAKGDGWITFIQDYDGNLLEIKAGGG